MSSHQNTLVTDDNSGFISTYSISSPSRKPLGTKLSFKRPRRFADIQLQSKHIESTLTDLNTIFDPAILNRSTLQSGFASPKTVNHVSEKTSTGRKPSSSPRRSILCSTLLFSEDASLIRRRHPSLNALLPRSHCASSVEIIPSILPVHHPAQLPTPNGQVHSQVQSRTSICNSTDEDFSCLFDDNDSSDYQETIKIHNPHQQHQDETHSRPTITSHLDGYRSNIGVQFSTTKSCFDYLDIMTPYLPTSFFLRMLNTGASLELLSRSKPLSLFTLPHQIEPFISMVRMSLLTRDSPQLPRKDNSCVEQRFNDLPHYLQPPSQRVMSRLPSLHMGFIKPFRPSSRFYEIAHRPSDYLTLLVPFSTCQRFVGYRYSGHQPLLDQDQQCNSTPVPSSNLAPIYDGILDEPFNRLFAGLLTQNLFQIGINLPSMVQMPTPCPAFSSGLHERLPIGTPSPQSTANVISLTQLATSLYPISASNAPYECFFNLGDHIATTQLHTPPKQDLSLCPDGNAITPLPLDACLYSSFQDEFLLARRTRTYIASIVTFFRGLFNLSQLHVNYFSMLPHQSEDDSYSCSSFYRSSQQKTHEVVSNQGHAPSALILLLRCDPDSQCTDSAQPFVSPNRIGVISPHYMTVTLDIVIDADDALNSLHHDLSMNTPQIEATRYLDSIISSVMVTPSPMIHDATLQLTIDSTHGFSLWHFLVDYISTNHRPQFEPIVLRSRSLVRDIESIYPMSCHDLKHGPWHTHRIHWSSLLVKYAPPLISPCCPNTNPIDHWSGSIRNCRLMSKSTLVGDNMIHFLTTINLSRFTYQLASYMVYKYGITVSFIYNIFLQGRLSLHLARRSSHQNRHFCHVNPEVDYGMQCVIGDNTILLPTNGDLTPLISDPSVFYMMSSDLEISGLSSQSFQVLYLDKLQSISHDHLLTPCLNPVDLYCLNEVSTIEQDHKISIPQPKSAFLVTYEDIILSPNSPSSAQLLQSSTPDGRSVTPEDIQVDQHDFTFKFKTSPVASGLTNGHSMCCTGKASPNTLDDQPSRLFEFRDLPSVPSPPEARSLQPTTSSEIESTYQLIFAIIEPFHAKLAFFPMTLDEIAREVRIISRRIRMQNRISENIIKLLYLESLRAFYAILSNNDWSSFNHLCLTSTFGSNSQLCTLPECLYVILVSSIAPKLVPECVNTCSNFHFTFAVSTLTEEVTAVECAFCTLARSIVKSKKKLTCPCVLSQLSQLWQKEITPACTLLSTMSSSLSFILSQEQEQHSMFSEWISTHLQRKGLTTRILPNPTSSTFAHSSLISTIRQYHIPVSPRVCGIVNSCICSCLLGPSSIEDISFMDSCVVIRDLRDYISFPLDDHDDRLTHTSSCARLINDIAVLSLRYSFCNIVFVIPSELSLSTVLLSQQYQKFQSFLLTSTSISFPLQVTITILQRTFLTSSLENIIQKNLPTTSVDREMAITDNIHMIKKHHPLSCFCQPKCVLHPLTNRLMHNPNLRLCKYSSTYPFLYPILCTLPSINPAVIIGSHNRHVCDFLLDIRSSHLSQSIPAWHRNTYDALAFHQADDTPTRSIKDVAFH